MPEIQPTEQSTEEIQQQKESQESLHANVLDKIKSGDVFKSLDLPIEDVPSKEEQRAQQLKEEQSQEEDNTEEENTVDTQNDEEVVPKSKIQPRIDQLTAQIKRLEQKLSEKESAAPVDDIQRQLDAMSEDSLEDSLTQVRVAKEKARDDDAKLLELVKLERRIEKTIATAPQKFIQNQEKEANSTINRLASEGELNNDNYPKILEIAKTIYQKYPKMQKAIDGQAMAIELAVEHYKQISKTSSVTSTVKAETQNLKGQINNLKKKTALDTKSVKSGGQNVNLDKLRSNAYTGTMKDKEKFAQNDPRFKIDAMIPDFLKG